MHKAVLYNKKNDKQNIAFFGLANIRFHVFFKLVASLAHIEYYACNSMSIYLVMMV